jgi:hypothetical protein
MLPYLDRSEEPQKPSAFERMTAVSVPWLTLLVAILALLGKPSPVLWAVFGLALLVLGMGGYPAVRAARRRRAERAKDRRAVDQALPNLSKFVRRFEEFVNTSTSDTLHSVLFDEVCGRNQDELRKLGILDLDLWRGFWTHLAERAEAKCPGRAEFQRLMGEFYDLVGLYNTRCVIRIFNESRPGFVAGLSPAARAALSAFQQRFMIFLPDYENFCKEVTESRPAFHDLRRVFSHPKPL